LPICSIHKWRGRTGCRHQPGLKRWPVLAAATCDNARWAGMWSSTFLQEDLRKLEAFHMRCQRMILGIRWHDCQKHRSCRPDQPSLCSGCHRQETKLTVRPCGETRCDTSLVVIKRAVFCERRRRNVYDKKPQRYAKGNRTTHLTARSNKSVNISVAYVTNKKRLHSTFC